METTNLFNYGKDIFEVICAQTTLLEAFRAVKRNKGSPGVDGVTIEEFEANLLEETAQLSKELLSWCYKTRPVKSVQIPKPGTNQTRELGIPCTRDRVVQAAIKLVLEPKLDPLFSESNFGFRPGKSQRDALEFARKSVEGGKEWCVDIDLAKFFDTIPQDRLIYRLSLIIPDKRVLRLVGITLRSGILRGYEVEETAQGTTQGSPLSPLLSNVVLDELDKELEKRKLSFARWADDCNIFVKSQKAAERVMESITKFIEKKLKLKVNKEKSKVALTKHVKFLGMTIVAGTLAIAKKSLVRAREKLREIIPRNGGTSVEQTLEKFNIWYTGWAQYFAMTYYPSQFKSIEAHARRRLRARIIKNCKRRKYLFRKLREAGASRTIARKAAYARKGPWALSGSPLHNILNVDWFINKGQKIFSDKQLSHWFHTNKWIALI